MDAFYVFLLLTIGLAFFLFIKKKSNKNKWIQPQKPLDNRFKKLLNNKIPYYSQLSDKKKKQFEFKIQEFLLNCKISGVETQVTDIDKLMVASSAIIPIFNFPNWQYINIDEVLIYPSSFNDKYETQGDSRNILGMVGSGSMEGKMILSKQALIYGFDNASDKKNTAIHEFAHLIDKSDGIIDGIPSLLLEQSYTLPWVNLMQQKIEEIYNNNSDINPYGATNKAEFFAVVSEYFFERPKLLKRKHPELYKTLEKIFNQKLAEQVSVNNPTEIHRNDPCICGSGKKYKKCCGKIT